jgi:hypothetical protein
MLAWGSTIGAAQLAAQATEPLLGTWALDVGKSTFSAGAGAPDTRTMTFDRVAAGIRHVTETSANQGGFAEQRYRLQYTFKIDGKEYPADVQMPVSTVIFKRIDANTIERSGKYRGEVVETVTYSVSADRNVLTVTQTGNLNGADVSSVQVFSRR